MLAATMAVGEASVLVLLTGAAVLAVERALFAWERIRGRNQR